MSYGPMTTDHLPVDKEILLKVLPEDEVKAIEEWISKDIEEKGCPDDTIEFLNVENPTSTLSDEEKAIHARCRALFKKFKDETGMDIELTWIPECESCYDTADEGVNWEFTWDSVWKKSPEAEAFEKKFGTTISTTFSTIHG